LELILGLGVPDPATSREFMTDIFLLPSASFLVFFPVELKESYRRPKSEVVRPKHEVTISISSAFKKTKIVNHISIQDYFVFSSG